MIIKIHEHFQPCNKPLTVQACSGHCYSISPPTKFKVCTVSLRPRFLPLEFMFQLQSTYKTFWQQKQLEILVGYTVYVEYGLLNWPITACVVTERCNKYMLFTGWEVRIVKNCDRGQHFQARVFFSYCKGAQFCHTAS